LRSHVDERRLVQQFVACLARVVHTWFGCFLDSAASAVTAGVKRKACKTEACPQGPDLADFVEKVLVIGGGS
jgi:hypothetical protein